MYAVDLARDAKSLAPDWSLATTLLRAHGFDGDSLAAELTKLTIVDAEIRVIRMEARREALEAKQRQREWQRKVDERKADAGRRKSIVH